ncbi:Retrovirus-related Pol polyprotein from transposon 17.6 [Senna tora]|uniref:Retrovirus-related Pol polyprotein from transposon 17.6 n=1 Tax=Senna tora TaxID=362788 RepID=A0A834X5P1_9FABA|nr:Retrovirus-related Pol polyprotein from transposon 17.6 [Senna tora]
MGSQAQNGIPSSPVSVSLFLWLLRVPRTTSTNASSSNSRKTESKDGEARSTNSSSLDEHEQVQEAVGRGDCQKNRRRIHQFMRSWWGMGHVAKGQGICRGLKVEMQGAEIKQNFYLFNLGEVDVILGIEWLESLGEVNVNWRLLTMRYRNNEKEITLKGDASLARTEVAFKTVMKSIRKGGQGFLIELGRMEGQTEREEVVDEKVQQLLKEFSEGEKLELKAFSVWKFDEFDDWEKEVQQDESLMTIKQQVITGEKPPAGELVKEYTNLSFHYITLCILFAGCVLDNCLLQINEPIPISTFLEQNGSGMKRIGDHSGPSVSDEVGFHDDSHISQSRKERLVPDEIGQVEPLFRRCLKVQMHRVLIPGMVERLERSLQALAVSH